MVRRLLITALLAFIPGFASAEGIGEAMRAFKGAEEASAKPLQNLLQSGCITSPEAQEVIKGSVQWQAEVAKFVKKRMSVLESRMATPMRLEGSGACDGSFRSIAREVTVRHELVDQEKLQLQRAGMTQLQALDGLLAVQNYEVKNIACAKAAFRGLQAGVKGSVHALQSLGNVGGALHSTGESLATMEQESQARLAGCGAQQPAAAVAVNKSVGHGSATRSPSSFSGQPARNGASSITGVKEDQKKRQRN